MIFFKHYFIKKITFFFKCREETFRADAFSYGAILFHSASLCDISEVEALKAVQTGAMKLKEKFTDIGKRYRYFS